MKVRYLSAVLAALVLTAGCSTPQQQETDASASSASSAGTATASQPVDSASVEAAVRESVDGMKLFENLDTSSTATTIASLQAARDKLREAAGNLTPTPAGVDAAAASNAADALTSYADATDKVIGCLGTNGDCVTLAQQELQGKAEALGYSLVGLSAYVKTFDVHQLLRDSGVLGPASS